MSYDSKARIPDKYHERLRDKPTQDAGLVEVGYARALQSMTYLVCDKRRQTY